MISRRSFMGISLRSIAAAVVAVPMLRGLTLLVEEPGYRYYWLNENYIETCFVMHCNSRRHHGLIVPQEAA